VGTNGSGGGDEGFVMDGTLDAGVPVLATAAGATLWGKAEGGWLYVATDAPAALAGRDVFLMIRSGGGSRPAPWAKSGQAAVWDWFLARESGNGWTGWFRADESLVAGSPAFVKATGAVFEGAVHVRALVPDEWGLLPAADVAMAAYATNDGGALQGQLPAGDGDGDLDAAEFVAVPLYLSAVPGVEAGRAVRLSARPTPFNAQVWLVLEGAADGPVSVVIHDARGRSVRRLTASAAGGRAQLTWDGRDEAGRNLASGNYFARAEGPRPAVARLTLVK